MANLILTIPIGVLNKLTSVDNLANKQWIDGNYLDGRDYLGLGDPFEIINKPLAEVTRYGQNVAWLLDLADSIFGRDTTADETGVLSAYVNQQWVLQQPLNNLGAYQYKYRRPDLPNPVPGRPPPFRILRPWFSLSRYWQGPQPAMKLLASPRDLNFNARVTSRDNDRCIISHISNGLVASHLIPNLMPHDAIVMILKRHSRTTAVAANIAAMNNWGTNNTDANNDPRIAVTVIRTLDRMVDNFTLGFFCPDPANQPDVYVVHYFGPPNANYNVLGITAVDWGNIPGANINNNVHALHGVQVTLGAYNNEQRTLDAAIRWHYMQCALRALATNAYKGRPVW